MGKRKEVEETTVEQEDSDESRPDEESSSDEDLDMVDVDFEWFDPQPDYDFHGIKTLLRQLFDVDAQLFDLSSLADLVLSQPLLGSTVKVDGNQTDPYAFLTVLSLKQHLDKAAIRDLVPYLKGRAAECADPNLKTILGTDSVSIGLILTERLINVPSEVAPPMFKMLLEEIQWAVDEKEPYTFTHFLMLSKTYQEEDSIVDRENDTTRNHKKQKKAKGKAGTETFFFHPEDEVLHKHAIAFGDFSHVKEATDGQSDSKRAFQEMGIKPKGHMILIEASKLEGAVKAMQAYFGQDQS